MTTVKLYNLARVNTATLGTGTLTLGSAITGYLSFADAGVQDGDEVSYGIKDGSNTEVGRGTYGASGATLTRGALKSTNGDSEINITSGVAEVYITPLGEDFDFTGDLAASVWTSTDVASASTCDIGAATTPLVNITGTTTITSFGTSTDKLRRVRFATALILTHNATSLILPGAANITTAAGDEAEFASDGSGNWKCTKYQRSSGVPVAIDTSGTLSSNSDSKVPSQKATKTYADTKVAKITSVSGGDLNTLTASGIYQLRSMSANMPGGGATGTMLVFSDISFGIQIVRESGDSNLLYVRSGTSFSTTPSWGGWKKIWTSDTFTLDTDGTLAGNSDTKVATQKAVKTYVDNITPTVDDASETDKGIVELATSAEAIAGTDTERAVTPKGLADARASYAAVSVGLSANFTTTATNQKLPLDSEVYDYGGYFASGAWTPPAGLVQMKARSSIESGFSTGSLARLEIWKNGSIFIRGPSIRANGTSAQGLALLADDVANGTDYYELYVLIQTVGTVIGGTTTGFYGVQLPVPL